MARHEARPALGRPAGDEADDGAQDAHDDFASEHEDTAVDKDITTGRDRRRREPESPRGWAGLEQHDWSGN